MTCRLPRDLIVAAAQFVAVIAAGVVLVVIA